MSASILKSVAARRTVYALKPEFPANFKLADLQATVQAIIKDTPSAFNSQGNRAVILTGETHKSVWDSVVNSIDSPDGKKRPASVRDEAVSSIIFFTDDKVTETLQEQFPAFASAFPSFADHSSGAAQITTWAAITESGLGGHLQHYNGYVKAALGDKIPQNWTVQAQLCVGVPATPAGEKTYIENPVKIFD
ncbi:putative nitroreductase [Maudiozyma exigua]|uniref:Nitroreductase n=1 Tax=Maudiozyma exigua TaxID=34358 RepID=A0A9P6VZN8_MAUEX|nr:putative nitroreductase [Kazachstania exigua]